jgi:hypothetical protein
MGAVVNKATNIWLTAIALKLAPIQQRANRNAKVTAPLSVKRSTETRPSADDT